MSNGYNTLIKEISGDFSDVYGGQKPAFISRAGGRVELIGGHTDYNEGFVIAAAIEKCCWVATSRRADNKICLYSELAKERDEFELSSDLGAVENCKWANYGRGVAALLLQEGLAVKGANLYIAGDIPVGAGLGSSAALEISLAKAMIHISQSEYEPGPIRLAQICQEAENNYVNSPCGIMDQIASIAGAKDKAILLDCRDLSIRHLPFDSKHFCIMIFNSMVKHEVGGGKYGKRREQCEQACSVLSKKWPHIRALRDVNESMLNSSKERLGALLFSRASHIIGENTRVLAAAEALGQNDMAEFGKLMWQSHCSARDLYEISCEETDFLAEQICQCDGAYGARISGGGFGGSVIALVRSDAAERISQKVYEAYRDRFSLDCEIYPVRCRGGAEIIEIK